MKRKEINSFRFCLCQIALILGVEASRHNRQGLGQVMTLFLQTEKVVFLVLAIFYLREWLLGRPTGLDIIAIWEALPGLPDK